MEKKLVREAITMAQPSTKPTIAPPKPKTAPGRPSPLRKDRPSVAPRPKASAEEVAKKLSDLAKTHKGAKELLNKYKNK